MQPLPEILRPQSLSDIVGQQHLVGENGILNKLIKSQQLPSIIFWGPPGVGKTTLAYILAKQFDLEFTELSGVEFSIKSLEELKSPKKQTLQRPSLFGEDLKSSTASGKPKVIFVDEIHRLNKTQQAQFLPYVERGEWILIGATTENPSFEVISPLLSRAQVIVLKPLNKQDLQKLIDKALAKLQPEFPKFYLGQEIQEFLTTISNGDARLLLNSLQALLSLYPEGVENLPEVKESLGNLHLVYDKQGEEHFDTISALHKSMRGSDPNAAVYYLGRMLEAGEDPLYVARRCIRFAAEDIGNADPMALVLANAAFEATHKLGMPESNVILAQLVIYLAQAPKSVAAYKAYKMVQKDIHQFGNLPIPLKIRNAPTELMQDLGYGEGYKYAPDYTKEELKDEKYLPEELGDRQYI